MWKDLSPEWKMTFQLAWDAFQHGSIPIGAIITDQAGNVLSTGRNHLGETLVPNPRTAHAEALCVRNLDISKYRNFNHYHLYTTMEPCPMCLGTIVMGGIRSIRTAARDRYCGALHYLEEDPYLRSKAVRSQMGPAEAGRVQIVLQTCHEYRRQTRNPAVLDAFAVDYPREVALGGLMYRSGLLESCAGKGLPFAGVYDDILRRLPPE
jgi:tRNA(adenine34) deaminase